MRESNRGVQEIARAYNASVGLPAPIEGHYLAVDSETSKRIAACYARLSVLDESKSTRLAYWALMAETAMQYEAALMAGIRFEFTTEDPYQNSAELRADVRARWAMKVYTGGEPHPVLGLFNDIFRGVHDLFGHVAEGYEFGARGEHNAWLHHSMMFSPLAQRALTTETRGQNSWVNFGPHSHLSVTERPFAVQKVALLPKWACDWRTELERGA